MPRPNLVKPSDSTRAYPSLPLVDLSTWNVVCNHVIEANAHSEKVLEEEAPWLLPEAYKSAKREMKISGLVGGIFDIKPSKKVGCRQEPSK